jgi:heme-degrading monooxygenase HmoA
MPDVESQSETVFWLLDGANELTGVRAVIWLVRQWPALQRELMDSRGYLGHRLWFAWPWTIGLTTWWRDEAAVYRFAHLPQHRRVWAWGAEPGHTNGGWLAHYRFVRGGPLWGNGVRVMASRFAGYVPDPSGAPARKVPPHGPRPA